MATNVKITCKYYRVMEIVNNDITESTFNLIHWLNDVNALPLEERYKEVNGISGRLEEITNMDNSGVYALNFMRTDSVSTSYKVKKDQPAEHIDIDIDEYIAKNTVCLYDSQDEIMMIQCNRGGYADSSIDSYINDYFERRKCVLAPIVNNINFLGYRSEYTKLDVRLGNIREYRPLRGSLFEDIIDGMNKVEGVNAHIEISMGRNRLARLNKGEMRSAIADLYENRGCVTSAKVKLLDDQVTGMYDLFDNLCKDDITVSINATDKGGIQFDKLARKMYLVYINGGGRRRVLNAIRS